MKQSIQIVYKVHERHQNLGYIQIAAKVGVENITAGVLSSISPSAEVSVLGLALAIMFSHALENVKQLQTSQD